MQITPISTNNTTQKNLNFQSKFTKVSANKLRQIAHNAPIEVYATLKMAKNDGANEILQLTRNGEMLFFRPLANGYYAFSGFRKSLESDNRLYHLYCPDNATYGPDSCDVKDYHYAKDEKCEELNKKYSEELEKLTDCSHLNTKISKIEKLISKLQNELTNLENTKNKKIKDFVLKYIDQEATLEDNIFKTFENEF